MPSTVAECSYITEWYDASLRTYMVHYPTGYELVSGKNSYSPLEERREKMHWKVPRTALPETV